MGWDLRSLSKRDLLLKSTRSTLMDFEVVHISRGLASPGGFDQRKILRALLLHAPTHMWTAAAKARAFPVWARVGGLALGYFAVAKASLVFAIPPGYATAIWPPSGIALGALLLWGLDAWPGVWLGAALTNFSIELSMPAALAIATGNTFEAVCAAWLIGRIARPGTVLTRPEHVLLFAGASMAASVIAASVGVTALYLMGPVSAGEYARNWYTWWQGDATGILLVTPCLLAWLQDGEQHEPEAGSLEVTIFAALLVAALIALFAPRSEGWDIRPLAFLALPFFVWAACRFNERIVTLTLVVANGWAIWCTVHAAGPFESTSPNEALLMLQAFTSTASLVALVLHSLLRQRAELQREQLASSIVATERLKKRLHELDDRIEEHRQEQALMHFGSWETNDGRFAWSEELCRIFAISPSRFEGTFEGYLSRVHPGDRDRVRATLKAAYANFGAWDGFERIQRPDGELRILRSIGRASSADGGQATRLQGIFIDVTPSLRSGVMLEAGELLRMVRAYACTFQRRTGVEVGVAQGELLGGLDERAVGALFRTIQEVLESAAQYSVSRRIGIELEAEPGLAALTMRDDGAGFGAVLPARWTAALARIGARAEALAGRMWLERGDGRGVTLRVIVRG